MLIRVVSFNEKKDPETEIPTRIELSGGLKVSGSWYQTDPIELSQTEILWYTWGFEKVSRFAVKVERVEGEKAKITINGQSCNATLCSMVDDAILELTLPEKEKFASGDKKSAFDFSKLVKVDHP